jgi:L-lactate dehydrogenase complex protein LldF
MRLHTWLARQPRLYHWLTGFGIRLLHRLGRRNGAFSSLPMASGWTSQRDFPAPEADTFMHQYRKQQAQHSE